MGNLMISIWT